VGDRPVGGSIFLSAADEVRRGNRDGFSVTYVAADERWQLKRLQAVISTDWRGARVHGKLRTEVEFAVWTANCTPLVAAWVSIASILVETARTPLGSRSDVTAVSSNFR